MDGGKKLLARVANFKSLPTFCVLVTLFVIFMIASPEVFIKPGIYLSFLHTIPTDVILALGLTLIITAGEIDLSFGSVVALSGYTLCYFITVWNNPWLGLVAAISAGALVGFINGILIAKIGIPSIMATLAAQFFWFGMTVLWCQGNGVFIGQVRGSFVHSLFVGKIGDKLNGIPAQFLWAVGLMILLWFILNRHKFGEAILFIGDNKDVAQVLGINVTKTKITLFTINGAIAGLAAVIYTLEQIQFYTIQGSGSILPVIAGVFIGGTSMAGGDGSILGSFFGMFIFDSIDPGVVATGVGGYYGAMIKGLVMACALSLNVILEKTRNKQKKWSEIIKNKYFPKNTSSG